MRWLNGLINGTQEQQQAEIDQYAHDLQLLASFRDNFLSKEDNTDVLTILTNQIIRQVKALQRIPKGDTFTIPDQRGEMVFTKNQDSTISITFLESNIK